jgi:hypothetical protein
MTLAADKPNSAPTTSALSEPSPASTSSSRLPPYPWRAHWLTVAEFSRVMGRSYWTVQDWVRDGTLAEFGIPVYQSRHGRRHTGRTFILNIY